MPKTPAKSSKHTSGDTADILHKPSSGGIVKSSSDSLDSITPKTVWEKKMDSENNATWVHIKDTLDYYNPKIFKFIENTSKFVRPTGPSTVTDVNCFEAQGIYVPNFGGDQEEKEIAKSDSIRLDTSPGDVTLAESFGELIYMTGNGNDKSLERYADVQGVLYPHIVVPEDDTANFKILTNPASSVYETLASTFSTSTLWNGLCGLVFNTKENLFAQVPDSLKISDKTRIRAFAWHKYKQTFAFSYKNSKVGVFHLPSESLSPTPLQHEFMKDVSCMEWRPNAGSEIAIGCRYGVCLWQNFPKKLNAPKDENDRMIHDSWFLDYRTVGSYYPINCLSWSPCGAYLAVGSANNTSVLVWNANYNSYVEHFFRTGVTCLSWSPNGYYLFAGGLNKCTVWETLNWTSQTWSFSSPCQSVCWSDESSYVAVAFADEPTLYFLQFHNIPPLIDARFIHKSSLHAYTVIKGDKEHKICGKIKEIVWDNTSNRIAVSFQESSLIAIFSTNIAPNLKVYPLGFIRGPAVCGKPLIMRFCNAFVRGALLSICWENGKISFIPLYFLGGHSNDRSESV